MQETVAWDMHTVYHPISPLIKLFFLYLFVLWIVLFVQAGILWRGAARQSVRARTLLDAILEKLRSKQFPAAAELASQLRANTPEAVLARSVPQTEDTLGADWRRSLETAAADYRFQWEGLLHRATGLGRASAFTLLFAVLCLFYEAHKTLSQAWYQKVLSGNAVAWRLADSIVPFTAGCFLAGVLYAAYAYFTGRLHRRRNHWEYFLARARQL